MKPSTLLTFSDRGKLMIDEAYYNKFGSVERSHLIVVCALPDGVESGEIYETKPQAIESFGMFQSYLRALQEAAGVDKSSQL